MKFVKIITLAMVVLAMAVWADGFDQHAQKGLHYGPNLSWNITGNTPFVWGQWLPQASGTLHYVWLEPLDTLKYGEKIGRMPSYLKMEGSVDVSPFYGGYMAGLGLRPFRTNPQVEVNFNYESFLYFNSNLEMVTSDVAGHGRISESWNADYITNNVWNSDEAALDYAQLFDFNLVIEFSFKRGSLLGVDVHYVLSDISTDFEGKSYDYKRNIPVFSRDYLIEAAMYGWLPLNENFALVLESSYYRTGTLRSGSTVEKEALSYGSMMVGPHFSWSNGSQNISVEFGGWKRNKNRFYSGSLSQQFLVQLEYQGYFSFPHRRHLTE